MNSHVQKNPIENLGSVTIINLDISYTPGFKKLSRKELSRIYGKELPPQEFITQGQGRMYPRSAVQIFDTLRVSARSICCGAGIGFLGGYAIPDSKIDDVMFELDKIRDRYLRAKQDFIAQAAKNSMDWIDSAPIEWQPALRGSTYSSAELDRKIGFEYVMFRMSPVESDGEKDTTEGLAKQAGGMSQRLLEEISQSADKAWAETLSNKDKCKQCTVDRIRKLCEKLHDLAWLSPKCQRLSEEVKSVMAELPVSGSLEGKDFMAFRALVLILRDPEQLQAVAESYTLSDSTASTTEDGVIDAFHLSRSIQPISESKDDESANDQANTFVEVTDDALDIFGVGAEVSESEIESFDHESTKADTKVEAEDETPSDIFGIASRIDEATSAEAGTHLLTTDSDAVDKADDKLAELDAILSCESVRTGTLFDVDTLADESTIDGSFNEVAEKSNAADDEDTIDIHHGHSRPSTQQGRVNTALLGGDDYPVTHNF